MTIAITRNVPDRFNGFINSCMHEIAPGVYAVPKMKKSVRERLWRVLLGWEELIPEDGGVVYFGEVRKPPPV
jgi:CRISPR-associated protein Cas2